jgi:hypothetical protein
MSVLTPCPDGITSDIISAWGDGALSGAESARLRAHVSSCASCQAHIQAYRGVSQLVREQRIPPASPVDIPAVRAGRPAARRRSPARRQVLPRAVWSGIGAAVAAALLIAAFSQVFAGLGHPTPTTTVTPHLTATPTAKLVWSERTIPPGLTINNYRMSDVLSLAFSPVNEQDGWLCEVNNDNSFTVWATTDQARSWHTVSHFTQRMTAQIPFDCTLTTDSVDPQVLALQFAWGCGACGTLTGAAYLSGDDGATWNPWTGHTGVVALTTLDGKTYALDGSSLYLSDQSLTSWRAVGPSAASTFVYLWPNRVTGELLLEDNAGDLWRTDNAGAKWTKVTLPSEFIVSWAESGGGAQPNVWRLCGGLDATASATQAAIASATTNPLVPLIQCTMDMGQTWTSAPAPEQQRICSNCGDHGQPTTSYDLCRIDAMTPDGSLYTVCNLTAPIRDGAPTAEYLYRLAPGATMWEWLGAPPTSVANPFATPMGTPIDTSSEDARQLFFTGNTPVYGTTLPASTYGFDVWYSDPWAGILAVATTPA